MDRKKQVVPEATLPESEESELTTRDEAYLGRTELDGSAELPPAPYSVDAAPNGEPPNAEPDGAAAPMELGVRDRQTNLFKPARRQPARDLVIGAGPPSEIYSAFKRLRNQIIKRLQENGWTTVAITSPFRASGTTLTAINLAISIARDFSYTVLLVELDLVDPSFRQVLSPVTNSSELLASPKMARLLGELKLRYEHRIVLFDLPAVLAIDDAKAFSPFVDCALLVVEEGETRVNDVRRALDHLKSTKILGVVLNRSFDVENDGKIISG
jgi:protein-tyrosine kinase